MKVTLSHLCRTALLFTAVCTAAQQQQPICSPGPESHFEDNLLDHLVGNWDLTGKMMGGELAQQCSAEWVLNHKFLRLECRETKNPPLLKVRYESTMYVGCSSTNHRYVVNLVDIFGASESLGLGRRTDNSIDFEWEYPEGGAFENKFTWSPDSDTWVSELRQKDGSGNWTPWGKKKLHRRK